MMKILSIIIVMSISMMSMDSVHAQTGRDSFEVQVDGLGCPFCAYGLEKKFKEFKGIKDIAIDIETGDFSFTYPAGKSLSMKAVLKQVQKAGYTPNDATIRRSSGQIETHAPRTIAITGDEVEHTFWVDGKCGMCKSRIEKTALATEGVTSANWNQESKVLSVQISKDAKITDVKGAIMESGHDLRTGEASEESYADLPPCCKYRRTK